MGNANSRESTSSACTSNTEPWSRAAACNTMLTTSSTAPHRHRRLPSSLRKSSSCPIDVSAIRWVARCCSTSPIATQSADASASKAAMSALAMGSPFESG